MRSKQWMIRIIVLAMLLVSTVACSAAPTPTVPPTEAPTAAPVVAEEEPTEAVVPTEAPTEEPTAAPEPEAEKETGPKSIILATTTSTQDSGLLDFILPDFEEEFGIEVQVVAVGTGQAIALGEDGNADVLLVHARSREDAFMEAGHGVRREDVMYNDFIIVGPEEDPAGIKGMTSATEAFAKIAEAEATFISRGDESGTHTKELSVWKAAGIEPAGAWYIAAGQGMGAVLTMAEEQQAYALTDRATYLAMSLEGLESVILMEGDEVLFNPYGVIAVNPEKGKHIKIDLANQFIDWIISVPTQEKIAQFGVEEFGAPLFTSDSALWRESQGESSAESEASEAGDIALKITGKVDQEMAWTEAEVHAMETMDVESTNKQGEASTYTGVSLAGLLEQAGVQADAETIVLVADDGYAAEVSWAEVQACEDCILSFRNQGGFSSVMPGFSGGLQVKGVIEVQVK